MIILNFSHPLTSSQLAQIQALTGQAPGRIVAIPCQIDTLQPLVPQVTALADACGLSSDEWQTLPLLVVPPSLNYVAAALLAEMHGRCGYFPAMLRLRPAPASNPPAFEVAEVVNLQCVRDDARARR